MYSWVVFARVPGRSVEFALIKYECWNEVRKKVAFEVQQKRRDGHTLYIYKANQNTPSSLG